MRLKLLSLFAFGILALVFAMGAVSADIVFNPNTTSATITSGTTSALVNFNLVHTGVGGNYTGLTWTSNSTLGTWTLPTSQTTLNTNESLPLTATLTGISSTFNGTITGSITVTASGGSPTETLPVTITVTSSTPAEIIACNAIGNPGQLEVRKIDFTNNGMQYQEFGKDDEWFPLDEVDVEIEIKNDGANDVDDVEVSWGLYDTRNNQWVIDYNDEDTFNIKDGDKELLTFSFKLDDDLDVDLEDLSDGDNYRLYVTALGTVDSTATPQPQTCVSDFEPASVVVESNFVVLDNFQAPETVSCGADVEFSADVWNIGDSDQDAVSVYVTNKELGLVKDILVGDMDAFDNQKVSFNFNVPANATEKTYPIKFEVYDEDSDVYQNDFDDDLSEFFVPLVVSGNCVGAVAPVTVTASLVSGGKAGQDLVVKAVVTNTGSSSATYTLSSSGQEQWASSYTVSPTTLTVAAGQSGEATYTFKVNSDAAGEQTFYVETVSGTQVARQPVSVMIESAGFLGSITGGAISENPVVWGLGLLIVILIVVIIVVAMKVMRK